MVNKDNGGPACNVGNIIIITSGQIVDYKLDHSRFIRCFGRSLVQKTVETMNISPIATYANYTARTAAG